MPLLAALMFLSADAPISLCDELKIAKDQSWAVAPFSCAPDAADACATLLHDVMACFKTAGAKVVAPGAVSAAVDEQALADVVGAGDTRKLQRLGELLAIRFLLVGEISKSGAGSVGLLRVISVEDGKIVSAVKVGAKEKAAPIKKMSEAAPNAIDAGLRKLADKLAAGFIAAGGRYKRIGVLDFKTQSKLVEQKGLPTLVSAELVTRLVREHELLVVERKRLDAVVNELAIAQSGLVDEATAPKVGKMAGADALVLGSIAEAGDRFVVTAQIVDAETGSITIAESADLKAEGLIALSSDALVLRTKGGAVFRSVLLPGWGQLYNKQPQKAYTFIGVLGGLVAATVGTGAGALVAHDAYRRAPPGANYGELLTRAENLYLARNVLLVGLAVAWAYNVLDAFLNGQTFDSAVSTSSGVSASGLSF